MTLQLPFDTEKADISATAYFRSPFSHLRPLLRYLWTVVDDDREASGNSWPMRAVQYAIQNHPSNIMDCMNYNKINSFLFCMAVR